MLTYIIENKDNRELCVMLLTESSKKDILVSAIQKSLDGARLSLDECVVLSEVSFSDLLLDHGLSYDQVTTVHNWARNEIYRMNASASSFGGGPSPEYTPSKYDSFPPLRESRKRELRRVIKVARRKLMSR